MPIPAFDAVRNVLPPHLGDPRLPADLSPYQCSPIEICDRFNTSPPRQQILTGLFELRRALIDAGINGFQWMGGSFVEDIEAQEARSPNDIDVVTFVETPADQAVINAIVLANLNLIVDTKATYHVDHFLLPLASAPKLLVEFSKYWYGLFSHRRDRIWKGMLVSPLVNVADDAAARIALGMAP